MTGSRAHDAGPGSDLVAMLEWRLNAERAKRRALEMRLASITEGADAAGDDPHGLAQRLERMVEERTRTLKAAHDEAVAASRFKSSFLANMSHEIRTPLTSIIGFAELMQDPRVPGAEKVDAAKTIVRNGRHLLEVINDILDLSKIESNMLRLEKIETGLPKLLGDVAALAAGRADEKSLRFTIEHHLPLPPSLVSDPVRLKQVLLNFCSNAVKFTSQGEVRLCVSFDAPARRLRFDVTDTGIGMTAAETARLFQPFVQADVSTTRRFGGTGLGLYISRQLADLLGGEIEVSSEPGRGSRFTLAVPVGRDFRSFELLDRLADFEDHERPAQPLTDFDLPTLAGRVLVAEDGADNQRLLASYLRQAGVRFDIVGNGRLAVQQALRHDYALVFMDIHMPEMDGVTATRLLREGRCRAPIVALTANVMQEDVALYRAAGCIDVLAKPIDRADFYDVLRRFVEASTPSSNAAADDLYAVELAQITAEFVNALPATFERIEQAGAAGDEAALKRLLHTLKGTAGSYGYAELTRLAADAEARLAAGSTADALAVCRGFATAVRRAGA